MDKINNYDNAVDGKVNKNFLDNIAFATFVLILLFETLSGALRYYLVNVGLTPIVYFPKVLAFVLLLIKIPYYFREINKAVSISLTFLAIILIGVLYDSGISNIGFSFFYYVPFFFSFVYARSLLLYKDKLYVWLVFLYLLCVLGTWLDYSTAVPWKNFTYILGNTEVEANRQWWAGGADRVAGFARVSNLLAMMLAIYALYIHVFLKSKWLHVILFLTTTTCIFISTSKITFPAYIIGVLFCFLRHRPKLYVTGVKVLVMTGIIFPFLSIILSFNVVEAIFSNQQTESLFSINDRINNTWPKVFDIIIGNKAPLWGVGFGNVGSNITVFKNTTLLLKDGGSLSVIDSTPLYLWSMFGILGLYFYAKFYRIIISSIIKGPRAFYALSIVLICICQISWTTDIPEAVPGLIFWGMGFGLVMNKFN